MHRKTTRETSGAGLWNTNVGELMQVFRDALAALAPILKRARIDSEEGAAYDDWDNVAEALFDGIIRRSIQWSSEGGQDVTLPDYGVRQRSYAAKAYIVVRDRTQPGERYILDLLTSGSSGFDSVSVLREATPEGDALTIPWDRASFAVRLPGDPTELTTLSVVL